MQQPRFEPDEDWTPDTQPEGRLGPPGRKPPTAIATATPRPPQRPYRPGRYRTLTTTQRIARAMLSVVLVASGATMPLIQTSLISLAATVGLGGLGAAVAIQLLRADRRRTVIPIHDRSR